MFQNISLIAVGLLVGLSLGMYAFFSKTPVVPQAPQAVEQASQNVQPVVTEEVVDPVVITAPMTAAEMLAAQVLPGQEQPQAEVVETQAPPVTAVQPPVPAVQTAATVPADISGQETVAPATDPNATTEIVATGAGTILTDVERRRIEEAQADAGWANARFLPKEALEVIQPQTDDKIIE